MLGKGPRMTWAWIILDAIQENFTMSKASHYNLNHKENES